MINLSSTTFQVQRRRFPLKPRSVRTPPAKFRWVPANNGWKIETITLTKNARDGCIYLNSDDCFKLTNGLNERIQNMKTKLTSFREAWWFFVSKAAFGYHPQFHQQAGEDTATISLRYKVPAEPAHKVPTRLSPKLRP